MVILNPSLEEIEEWIEILDIVPWTKIDSKEYATNISAKKG